jgi:hypothetical protein
MADYDQYFDRYVVPSFRHYVEAEARLSNAVESGDQSKIEAARDEVMLSAMNAVVPAHHLSDVIIKERPAWLPSHINSLANLRQWAQTTHCKMLRGSPIDDLDLLGDVADAFKHHTLTHGRRIPRRITSAKATITTATGYGQMHFGEGKYGGAEQVIVQTSLGKRALSSILQNIVDMWRSVIGRPPCPFDE